MQIYLTLTFITLLPQLTYQIYSLRTCVPNSKFIFNNYLCYCNNLGLWNESSCTIIQRRHFCQIGHTVREGCNRCVCQTDGQFLCTNAYCPESNAMTNYGVKCTPFRSYHINCNLCICPASGVTSQAQCTKDASCLLPAASDFQMIKKNYCIPNVMYVFPCIHCLCSESGIFVIDKCTEKCQKTTKKTSCIPGAYYIDNCYVCSCPENGIPDQNLCTNVHCNNDTKEPVFKSLRDISSTCTPFTFVKPKCLYCQCDVNATVDDKRCVELDCSKNSNYQYYVQSNTCSPGEMVPHCVECICPRNGSANIRFCSNTCSLDGKLELLTRIVNESLIDDDDVTKLHKEDDELFCVPDNIYLEEDKICWCPENGYKSFEYCITPNRLSYPLRIQNDDSLPNKNNLSTHCDPGTYVEFDCNVCYCTKDGRIDPKWCTYDNCIAKNTIQATQNTRVLPENMIRLDGTCVPGSISKEKCNFCICPENGNHNDRACTQNNCDDENEEKTIGLERFICEPLTYYEIDCNICFCPRNGIKNLAKCTKNQCEKSFLRSNDCTPGQLFTDKCNVCVCPTNGDKTDRVCTKYKCDITSTNDFKLTQSLLSNSINNMQTRTLDHCIPGEEFTLDCKICICPETGLRMYASCDSQVCTDDGSNTTLKIENKPSMNGVENDVDAITSPHNRIRRFELYDCKEYQVKLASERHDCTPGSMYYVRCKQCICPYMGNINLFCRPLPRNVYCEEAYPGYNYLPMGRRVDEGELSAVNETDTKVKNETIVLEVSHEHTKYGCEKIGKIMDRCHICACEEDPNGLVVIEEHCFKSDEENCKDTRPSFLSDNKLIFI